MQTKCVPRGEVPNVGPGLLITEDVADRGKVILRQEAEEDNEIGFYPIYLAFVGISEWRYLFQMPRKNIST